MEKRRHSSAAPVAGSQGSVTGSPHPQSGEAVEQRRHSSDAPSLTAGRLPQPVCKTAPHGYELAGALAADSRRSGPATAANESILVSSPIALPIKSSLFPKIISYKFYTHQNFHCAPNLKNSSPFPAGIASIVQCSPNCESLLHFFQIATAKSH